MASKGWGRRKRHEDEPIVTDPDNVDLSGDEHAWWADRDDLMGGVPEGGQGSSRRKGHRVDAPREEKHSGFEDYFSSESLFRPPTSDDKRSPSEDPYGALGLKETATWEEITAAHRRLAMEHHPDRVAADAPSEQRLRSESFIRDLNIAYMELRRRRGR